MKIVDTYSDILKLFQDSRYQFNKKNWQIYANNISFGLSEKCLNDSSSYDFQKDVLPVLERAISSKGELEKLHTSFISTMKGLKERVIEVFGIDPQVDIILYLGLCNGAGWVTKLDNKTVILLGVEKIIELDWCDIDSMTALIYHELGHVLHDAIGTLCADTKTVFERSIWQLYQEGFAMYCEQILINNFAYFHQNKNDWLSWCERNKKALFLEYKRRVNASESTQDFFGDWCSYKGYSDVGYYLGCELIKSISIKYSLKELANLRIKDIYDALSLWE